MDVWECDLMDMQSRSKYNDKYKYLLSVIDDFTKFLHIVPLRSKTGTTVSAAFRSKLAKYSTHVRRRRFWVGTDRCKELLDRSFQAMFKKEGIQFQVCRDPNAKCAIVERSHGTIRDTLYKYMTYRNTYRFIHVLQNFVRGYNDTIHSTTSMAPSKVTDSDILAIWNKMRSKHSSIRCPAVRFSVGQHVRISKEKLNFAKGDEETTLPKYLGCIKLCAVFSTPSTNCRIC